MNKQILILLFLTFKLSHSFSQESFSLNVNNFEVGQIYRTNIDFNLSFPLNNTPLPALDSIAFFLTKNKSISLEIGVNTDYKGTVSNNEKLSTFRAQYIYKYFIQKGIDSSRLLYKGYGEGNPITVNKEINQEFPFLAIGQILNRDYIISLKSIDQQNVANRLNRRTELKIIKIWL